ncbi:probable trehalose-phosphate phosphatase 8 [Panicum virgatum]|uniref:Trehalose 6-phosphate phosphatase n=1 Tax=Panicum virgatum TaxID=38727 RepID=A0A8T0T552_PANVG|nr:probable trehalose-phosphate phosphatase 8 [Panicum virgatum]KAG2605407.1 hypothetical protein PVAP13_4NG075200 [Panicum virgatum]
MSNQDVVLPDMGIAAAAAALPGPVRALFACRGAAGAVSSLRRGAYGGLGLPGAADGGAGGEPLLGARAAPAPAPVPGRTCTSRVVENIRASSPTRCPAVDECDAWTRKHPSALGSFDEVAAAATGKRIVMFMDYDGTLSPIVTDPDMAFMTAEMREAVRGVAKHFPTAIVTGRCVEKVCSFVGLSELYYAGSHGVDIKGPSSKDDQMVLLQPAREFLPVIDKAFRALEERTRATPGARVEHNKFCLSVHFRCVAEKSWSPLAEQVKAVLRDFPKLKLTEGRKVLEIRPAIMWDKGRAVEFLLKSLGFDDRSDVLPVYIGDDRTDEDAFKVLKKRGQGLGILVSKCPKETDASYSLQDPTEVMEFLVRLVEWKRLRSPSPAARPRAVQPQK